MSIVLEVSRAWAVVLMGGLDIAGTEKTQEYNVLQQVNHYIVLTTPVICAAHYSHAHIPVEKFIIIKKMAPWLN